MNHDDDDADEFGIVRPFDEPIGRPEITLRLIHNLQDEFYIRDIHPDDKYLLIEMKDPYYYYDSVQNQFRRQRSSFSGVNPYDAPLREYIVSFKSFLLAAEIGFDDENDNDDDNNHRVLFHFIWTRKRNGKKINEINGNIEWDYINNNLDIISDWFEDPDKKSNHWLEQRDFYQYPSELNDPNHPPRFVLFYLGKHSRKITDPLGTNRGSKIDITLNDILRGKLDKRGQRFISGPTKSDQFGKRAANLHETVKRQVNSRDFLEAVEHCVYNPNTPNTKTNITSLPHEINDIIAKYLGGPQYKSRGGKTTKKKKIKRGKTKQRKNKTQKYKTNKNN
jgi:hypothetical protein